MRSEPDRHPSCARWVFPPADRRALSAPLQRVNLRELMARPSRFEHHLSVVASIGCAQLEAVVASEPLFFAHLNVSDEYAISLETGDAFVDGQNFLTLLADPETGADVGRIKHGVGDLVLHPHGLLHWPGRLRPPWTPLAFPPGARRTGLSAVFCARPTKPQPPHAERPLFVSAGREAATKAYASAELPMLLAELRAEAGRVLARVGDARMTLVVEPDSLRAEAGAYLLILAGADAHAPGDLVYMPPGSELDGAGLQRALCFESESGVEPPPPLWRAVALPPFAPFEDGPPGQLPVELGGLRFADASEALVRVSLAGHAAEIPRYWLARMLFRVALHGYAIGYLETYGGLFYDDRDGQHRLGLRGAGSVTIDARELARSIEGLYRAVAPAGYVERLA